MSAPYYIHEATSTEVLDDGGIPNAVIYPEDVGDWRMVSAISVVRGYPWHTTVVVWYWEKQVSP